MLSNVNQIFYYFESDCYKKKNLILMQILTILNQLNNPQPCLSH